MLDRGWQQEKERKKKEKSHGKLLNELFCSIIVIMTHLVITTHFVLKASKHFVIGAAAFCYNS